MRIIGTARYLAIGVVALTAGQAHAVTSATVDLFGGSFIQSGEVTNNATNGESIVSFIYSLGTAADGIATWDTNTAGGVASDFLSDATHFQTVTFDFTLSPLAPGALFAFGGLDIDRITTLLPLVINTGIDVTGSSLVNASVTVVWDNGDVGTTPLAAQGWFLNQNLTVEGMAVIPEPLTATLGLMGLGVLGVATRRRAA